MENKNGFLQDNLGDKSSKRLTSFILLGFALSIGIFGAIASILKDGNFDLIKYVFTASLSGSLLAQGLTLPELFSKKG